MPIHPNKKVSQKVVTNEKEVIVHLSKIVEDIARNAIEKRRSFHVGLSGGSLIKFLCSGLPSIETDWSRWILYFCDERLVPTSSPDSTLQPYLDGLVGKTPLTVDQFIKVDVDMEASDAASAYEAKIREKFPDSEWPEFDLLLLGMGPDGHTASLFPDHPLLKEDKLWVAPITDSPKPPPCRVTLTLPVINHARFCLFAMAGEGKADMVKRVLGLKENLPVSMVSPVGGDVIWIMDEGAASKL